MTRILVLLFGALYLFLGVWCLAAPAYTSRKVGFELLGGTGRSEFLVVYGGLEVALGLFFLLCGLDGRLLRAGALLALVSSACLMATRLATLFLVPGLLRSTYLFFGVEVLMAAAAALAFFAARPE
jgi:hypothetical protein